MNNLISIKSNKDNLNKATKGDKTFDIVSYIFLLLFTILIFYPIYFVIIASFSDPTYIATGEVLIAPKGFNVDGYGEVFKNEMILSGYMNSFLYAIVGTVINLFVTLFAAYPLARKGLRGKTVIMIYFTITMFINGGMIPNYINLQNLGLIDTMWAIVLPGAVSVYNIIIARTYLQSSIPKDLNEAASIDGCGHIRYFFSMVMPLSGPIIAVLILFSAVGLWNSYMAPMLYLSDNAKYPLQVVLRSILIQNQTDIMIEDSEALIEQLKLAEKMKYSLIIIASIPVLMLYPLVQKHLVKGIMLGSLKG